MLRLLWRSSHFFISQSEKNRPERIRTMLDYLQRRGPKAFELFLVCLRESDHSFVASYLLQVLKHFLISSDFETTVQNHVYNL